ncbi:MAG: hypothetical protein HY331_19120 [Chloroflexi bacterium]|nr:hypothetical protein [Chloroflexota bacterium]
MDRPAEPGGSGRRDDRLRAALQRLHRARPPAPDLRPGSAYEALLDERIRDVEKALLEVRSRVNTLFYAVISAVLLEVLIRLSR